MVGVAVAAVAAVAAPAFAAPAPIMVYNGNNSQQPSEGYAGFGTASGRPISIATTLPADLQGTACVVLNLNRAVFDAGQVSTLSQYLIHGGSVLTIGEHGGYAPIADANFNTLSTALGSTMRYAVDFVDSGPHTTTNIDVDLLTQNVHSINYAAASTLTYSGTARSLVRTAGGATFIAAQQIGLGRFVMSGDSNMWQGPAGDERVLVANICGVRRTTSTTLSCSPASPPVGVAALCTMTVADTDTGAPSTPTGVATFDAGDSPAGTFPDGNTCTLMAAASPGSASCSVRYVAQAAGARTVLAAYSGDNTVAAGTDSNVIQAADTATTEPDAATSPEPTAGPPSVCVSARKVTLHWRLAKRWTPLRSIKVTVNGKVISQLRGSARKTTVDFTDLRTGDQSVRVLARGKDGSKLSNTRAYRTCTQIKRAGTLPTLTLHPSA